jgi:AcrR family transcriptional regulator
LHIGVCAVNIWFVVAVRPGYHHGNLRAALIDAGVELARAGGPDAVVVREASRRVGVSHNAAYRHFPDRDALLKAVAERSMSELARLMERLLDEVGSADAGGVAGGNGGRVEAGGLASGNGGRGEAGVADVNAGRGEAGVVAANRRLRATGIAYVRFALSEPGLFRTAFAVPRRLQHFGPGEGAGDSGLNPYELLNRELDQLVTAGGLPPERRPYADVTAWSAVHGISMLMLEGPLRDLPDAERRAAVDSLLDTIERGLVG